MYPVQGKGCVMSSEKSVSNFSYEQYSQPKCIDRFQLNFVNGNILVIFQENFPPPIMIIQKLIVAAIRNLETIKISSDDFDQIFFTCNIKVEQNLHVDIYIQTRINELSVKKPKKFYNEA